MGDRALSGGFAWEGVFTDTFLGGSMHVCVSNSNAGRVGQAVISNVGYMHGLISDTNQWTGEYILAGEEPRQGTFSLILSGDGESFTGQQCLQLCTYSYEY